VTTTVTGSPAPTARSLAADPGWTIAAGLGVSVAGMLHVAAAVDHSRSRTVNALLVLGGLAWAAWLTGVLG
jgi:hypothetical protein